jgi:hypothetical protein
MAIDELTFEDCVSEELNEPLKPSCIVNSKKHGYLMIVEKTNEGFLCCKKDEPAAQQKSNGIHCKTVDISQYVKF